MTVPATTKQQIATLLEGILLGRTFHDLEKQAGVSAEALLLRLRNDEDAAIGLSQAREVSAYAMESELLDKARSNMEAPESAVANNAVKIWTDVMKWAIERRNPAIFSGKANVEATMVVKFDTSLDLNAPKNMDGVYELTATHVKEAEFNDLARQGESVEPLLLTGSESSGQSDIKSVVERAVDRLLEETGQAIQAEAEENGPVPRSAPRRRHHRVEKAEPRGPKARGLLVREEVPAKPSRVGGKGQRKGQTKNAEAS